MGSSAFVRPALLERFRASVDGEGQTFAEALRGLDAQCFDIPVRNMSLPFFAFIEAHIEGGTVLEDAATPLGIVEGVQGARWFTVRIAGRTAHPGTTPLARKQDALMAAVEVAADIYKVLRDGDERLRLTIGRMLVTPGSINVVPGEVVLSVDLRHPDTAVLDTTEATIRELARPVAGCSVEIERTMLMNPTRFDPGVVQTLTREAERLHLPYLLIGSGSFHDALRLSEHCPTGMLFVPSVGGVSHHPDERTEPRDLVIGARLLAQAVVDLADQ
jgi:N-carbamoyl-L-amino-acid hydrolase